MEKTVESQYPCVTDEVCLFLGKFCHITKAKQVFQIVERFNAMMEHSALSGCFHTCSFLNCDTIRTVLAGGMQQYGFGAKSNHAQVVELYRKAAESGSEPVIRRLKPKEPDPSINLIKRIENVFSPE